MINPHIQKEVDSHVKEILATVSNSNKFTAHDRITRIRLISMAIEGLSLALSLYKEYIPNISKNPSPLWDAINAEREELIQWRKTL